jgi:hypothetical protein
MVYYFCYTRNKFVSQPLCAPLLRIHLFLFLGGIQAATAQLPLLQLMDCGMSLRSNLQNEKQGAYFGEINGRIRLCPKLPTILKKQPMRQKLIIKHDNLKKLSLWGCSAIDVRLRILLTGIYSNPWISCHH